jgi:hypothetical protein
MYCAATSTVVTDNDHSDLRDLGANAKLESAITLDVKYVLYKQASEPPGSIHKQFATSRLAGVGSGRQECY